MDKQKIVFELWQDACSGNVNNLMKYFDGGGAINQRCYAFGKNHSLIAGAYRNRQYETIKYLLSVGETILPEESEEIQGFINRIDKTGLFVETLNLLESFMITENWYNENVPEQARAIFTTLCIIGEIEADTLQADNILKDLYKKAAMDSLTEYDEFENYMYKLIV